MAAKPTSRSAPPTGRTTAPVTQGRTNVPAEAPREIRNIPYGSVVTPSQAPAQTPSGGGSGSNGTSGTGSGSSGGEAEGGTQGAAGEG